MIHLKIKTEYSFGQTYAPIPRVIERLTTLKCTAAGIVDTGTWGHIAWHKACIAAGITPLLGAEACVSDDDIATHMWFLAKNKSGLQELYKLISRGYKQPLSTRSGKEPRLYYADIEAVSDNIIKFAGDIVDGEFLKHVNAYVDLNPSISVMRVR